ncbi:MAG: efflux RND transporter permease subunit [Bacteroidales bacterium]|nr:efflux RND transporter permease subunit [Bacteroidales bacterium]
MKRVKIDFIAACMRNHTIVILVVLVLMITGVIALIRMPRNEYPQFTIRQGVIVGIYPGATSAEVEEQLTRVVENYIYSYKEVNKEKTYSLSKEGIMYIFVELTDQVTNSDQFWSKIRHGLNELKMKLPSGVLALIANSDFGDTSAILITLSSESKSYKDLEEQVKRLEAECRKIPTTSKIRRYGIQKEKIFVNVKPELLNEYSIKTISLLGSYQLNGMVNYAGVLKDGRHDLAVHLPASFASENDLAEQIVYADPAGNVIRLKDIATIERKLADPDNYIRQNGMKTVLVSLEMQPGNNIVQFGKDVEVALKRFEKGCPKEITVSKISELPKYVQDSISNFMKEFLIAIIAVILVTMILLPFRISSVAAVTIPVSVLVTMGILYALHIELHTVSLATLIVVLGMIVDNSIVIIDNHVTRLDRGGSPWHTAIASARELFTPIVAATLAIFAAYFPLNLFLTGAAGEFTETIPVVVGVALTVSILVAVFLVPYLNYSFIKKGLKRTNPASSKKSFLEILQNAYDKSLEKAFKHPWITIGTGIISVILALFLLAGLDRQIFPTVERNQFPVEIYLPSGASLERTAEVVDSMAVILKKDKRVTNVTSFIGTSSPRFHTVYAPQMPATNFGQLLVNTVSNKATIEVIAEYGEKYAEYFTDAHVKMKELALQPNKEAIEIRISSDSIRDIRLVQEQIREILKKNKHITWIHDDWDQKRTGITVNLDRDKANRLGYSKGFIATSLMVGLDGIPLTTIWEDDYPVEVMLTQETKGPKDIRILEDQYITSPVSLKAIPLRSFSTFTPDWNEGTIVHRNGVRTLTIMVDNDSKVVASSVFNELKPQIDGLKLPDGTTISYGGEYEGQAEVFTPMTYALAISIVIIFFILLVQFKKTRRALLIMSAMLLTLPGAAIGLYLMGYPFSLTSFLGITSLCGLVVRNGIILIDYLIDLRKSQRMTVYESALAAGKRRMRPIFLTSAAAAVGVIPMIISRSLLWGPLGTVICFGLIVAMFLTLYILPVLYWTLYKHEDRPMTNRIKGSGVSLKSAIVSVAIITGFTMVTHGQKVYTLDQCKQLALQNNIRIQNGILEVESSRQVRKAAFTKYFPSVSATALAVRFNKPLIELEIPGGNLPVYNGDPSTLPFATQFAYFPGISMSTLGKLTTGFVTATQPVFTGGRIYFGNKLARLGYDVSSTKQSLSTNEVLLETEKKYWQILTLKEKLKTIDRYDSLLRNLRKDVNKAQQAGLVNYNDVLKVTLKQSELELNRLKLNNKIRMLVMAFCQHLGVPYDSLMNVSDTLLQIIEPAGFRVDHKTAVSDREEYRLIRDKVEAENLQYRMKLGKYLPELGVGVGAFSYNMSNSWNNNLMAFGSLNIPLSDWWAASHELKEQKLREEIAANQVKYTAEMLNLEMENAWSNVIEAYQQIKIGEEAVRQAEENLKITGNNYHAGINNVSDLLEAQAILQKTNDDLSEARFGYFIHMAEYRKTTGTYR